MAERGGTAGSAGNGRRDETEAAPLTLHPGGEPKRAHRSTERAEAQDQEKEGTKDRNSVTRGQMAKTIDSTSTSPRRLEVTSHILVASSPREEHTSSWIWRTPLPTAMGAH